MDASLQINLVTVPPLLVLALGLVVNLALARDSWVRRAFEGPIEATNRFLGTLEQRYNRPDLSDAMRKADGISTMAFLFVLALVVGIVIGWLVRSVPYGWVVEAMIIAAVLVQRAHLDRTRVVTRNLEAGTEQGRAALALISNHDTHEMDRSALARTSVEMTARVCFEGVMAPVIYYLVFGLPGLLVVRLVNTFHHLIDERTPFGACFGWAPARLNAVLLVPVALIAPAIVGLAAATIWPARMLQTVQTGYVRARDHFSTLLGPVSAAFAGALNIRLGGPARIHGTTYPGRFYGGERVDVDTPDMRCALVLLVRVSFVLALILAAATAFGWNAPIASWLIQLAQNPA